jgi:hypothetical protein
MVLQVRKILLSVFGQWLITPRFGPEFPPLEALTSILELGTFLDMDLARCFAIQALAALTMGLSPVVWLSLSLSFRITEWIEPAFRTCVQRARLHTGEPGFSRRFHPTRIPSRSSDLCHTSRDMQPPTCDRIQPAHNASPRPNLQEARCWLPVQLGSCMVGQSCSTLFTS